MQTNFSINRKCFGTVFSTDTTLVVDDFSLGDDVLFQMLFCCHMLIECVAGSRNLSICCVITSCTCLIRSPSNLCARCSLGLMADNVMSKSLAMCESTGPLLAADTALVINSLLRACGRTLQICFCCNLLIVGMFQRCFFFMFSTQFGFTDLTIDNLIICSCNCTGRQCLILSYRRTWCMILGFGNDH